MIQVDNLVKKYGPHLAVDHLSFSVKKGQIYGFLGPNGAGKSTTMNIMTGYIASDSGVVTINDYDILKDPEKAKRSIGYLPENPPLYTDMTVKEYLCFAAELKKVPKKDRPGHVDEIVEMVQLTDVKNRLIRNISKGYKQRVGLAQALVGNPEVLILDEPMVGLDPKQIIEMRDLIKSLAGDHTIILSSHILSEISAVCDHIMIISQGKLAASGSPQELQEMMRTKTELEIIVFGTKERAEEIMQKIGGIEAYKVESAQEADSVRILLTEAGGEDMRRELSVALSQEGMPILSMNRIEKSLEDIFLELTGINVDETVKPETDIVEANAEIKKDEEELGNDSDI